MENETRVGPYEIRERIGEGGMATVYKAWHTGLHRFEALKVPRHGYGGDAEFVHRLLTEARTAAALHHPHIVAIHNISDDGADQPYFAMDLVDGFDLETLLRQRTRLPFPQALSIIRQVADALDYAHTRGVAHRDVKPANILLQPQPRNRDLDAVPSAPSPEEWTVKVVDFGISRAGEDVSGTRLTKSGMLVGTPEYMSPEQAGSGEVVDYRTDIYSLAVVAYEMLTGQPPFTAGEGVSRMSILMSHVFDTAHPPTAAVPSLPPSVDAAIARALVKHPSDRFASCDEFVRALQDTAPATPLVATPPLETLATPSLMAPTAPQSTLVASSRADSPLGTSMRDKAVLSPTSSPCSPRWTWAVAALAVVAAGGWLQRAQRPNAGFHLPNSLPFLLNSRSRSTAMSDAQEQMSMIPSGPIMPPMLARRRVRERHRLPFARKVRATASLASGRRRILRRGKVGIREMVWEETRRAGRSMSRRVVANRVLKAPISQIELRGTRPDVPSPSGDGQDIKGQGATANASSRKRLRRRNREIEREIETSPHRRTRRREISRLRRSNRRPLPPAPRPTRSIEAPLPP